MSQNDQDQQQVDDQELQEQQVDENGNPIEEAPAEEEPQHNRRNPMSGFIGWIISAAMHAIIIMLMGTVYFLVKEEDVETPPVRISEIPPPPQKKEEKPKLERDITKPTVELDIATQSDNPSPITQLDLPVETSSREEDTDSPTPKGREEAVADSEMGGSGAFMAIGAGGGAAGMFGSRSGGGKRRAVGRGGGSKGSESAVDAALRWLKKHQSPSGAWEGDNYFKNCTEDPKCEPGSLDKWGPEQVNTALTGYALLCFLGAGYDHKTPNKFKPTVKKGIDYLLSIQKPDGLMGKRNYEHAVAAMALAEAYAMTNDPDLRGPAQKSIDIVLKEQNIDPKAPDKEYAGMGWNYNGPSNRHDSSVTGWNVMALKSAYAGGLNVGNGMEGAKRWLDITWKMANPDWQKLDVYSGKSKFPYSWENDGFKDGSHASGRECIGMVCAVFLGHKAGDTMLETLASTVMASQVPKSYPCNTYYMYYNTLGIFQVGGEKWKVWNSTVRDMLVGAQRRGEGCFDGSWDWQETKFHGSEIGRVLSTVYNCLCLEVYYRYAVVTGAPKPGEKH